MKLYREFKLLQRSVFGLHRFARRRDYLHNKIVSCMAMSENMLMSRSLKGWREQSTRTRCNIKFAYFSILALK